MVEGSVSREKADILLACGDIAVGRLDRSDVTDTFRRNQAVGVTGESPDVVLIHENFGNKPGLGHRGIVDKHQAVFACGLGLHVEAVLVGMAGDVRHTAVSGVILAESKQLVAVDIVNGIV